MGNNGMEFISTWTQQGKSFFNSDTPNDLFFAPEKHEGWANLYKLPNKDCAYYMGSIYNSKAEAENKRDTSDLYVATIKFEWVEQKMNEKLKTKKVIFCDLDGTLIETISGETFPKGIWDKSR